MAADGSIAGTVTGAGSGPIAGDHVCAQSTTSTFGSHCAVTASSGGYTIENVPTGNYRVHFEGKGEFVGEWYEDAPSTTGAKVVTVTEGATAGGVDADLAVGAAVEGVVTDASGGQALDHIQVCAATTASYPINNGCTTSGPDGHYRLAGIPTGEYKLRFAPGYPGGDPDYLPLYYPDAESAEGGTALHLVEGSTVTGINVAMHLGGTISGTVLDAAGNPVGGARACVYPILGNTNDGYCYGHSAIAAADGTYTIHGVPSGEYKVSFSTPGGGNFLPQFYPGQPTRSAGGAITVAAPGAVAGIDASLRSGGVISGTVTESGTGQALSGLAVCANRIGGTTSFCTQTTTDGSYSIRSLASGDFQVTFAGQSSSFDWPYLPTSTSPVHVTAGAATEGIGAALDKGGTISGKITDATTGEPAEGIYVCAISGGEIVGSCVTTHASGEYTVIGLPAGSYAVRATPAGGGAEQDFLIGYRHYVPRFYPDGTSAATATLVAAGPGIAVTGKDIEMREGGGIAGTVTGPLGEPLPGIEACVVRSDEELGENCATSDAGGHYEIAGLNPGDYVASFWAAGAQTQFSQQYFQGTTDFAAATPVTVTGSAVTPDIDAQMQPTGIVEGTVTDAFDGTPLADVWVCAEKIGGTGGNCTETAADGSYSMAVGAGSYTVEFSLGYLDQVDGEEVEVEEFVTQFFDDAASAGGATAVSVLPGSTSSGIDASLAPAPGRLDSVTVAPTGSGSGAITSTPAGIDCGATCAEDFETRKTITLHAEPAPGSTFTGWSGACTGTGPCQVRLTAAAEVSATFLTNGDDEPGPGRGGEGGTPPPPPAGSAIGTPPVKPKPQAPRPKPKHCHAGRKAKKVGKQLRCVKKPSRHPHRKHRANGR